MQQDNNTEPIVIVNPFFNGEIKFNVIDKLSIAYK